MTIPGATDTEVFRGCVREVLCPTLRCGDLVIMDNLAPHKNDPTLRLVKMAGARILFLPAYSPYFNPIEKMWGKVKALLRSAEARTLEELLVAIDNALAKVSTVDSTAAIPTQVGNTEAVAIAKVPESGHPHAGGEYDADATDWAETRGPSPRRWGIPPLVPGVREEQRAIPTQVGNTTGCAGDACCYAGHPHAGGEYPALPASKALDTGPSPRRWGIQVTVEHSRTEWRAIPTQVGNTSSYGICSSSSTGHPRAGGEYVSIKSKIVPCVGPSPRRWGIRMPGVDRTRCRRAIPTQVGNTRRRRGARRRMPGHPHAGGEYTGRPSSSDRSSGPSPRRWGIRRRKCRDRAD